MEVELFDEPQTLAFRAAQIESDRQSEDIPVFVRDSVSAIFNAYRPQFDNAIRAVKGQAGSRGLRGGAVAALVTEEIYPFTAIIISEINPLAQRLSAEDRQVFWLYAEQEITKTIERCSLSQGGATGNISYRVSSQVRVKKNNWIALQWGH